MNCVRLGRGESFQSLPVWANDWLAGCTGRPTYPTSSGTFADLSSVIAARGRGDSAASYVDAAGTEESGGRYARIRLEP